jgi:hypothetical protein
VHPGGDRGIDRGARSRTLSTREQPWESKR